MSHITVIDHLASLAKWILKRRLVRILLSILVLLALTDKIIGHFTPLPYKMAEWITVAPDLKKADVILVLSGGADLDHKTLEAVTLARAVHGITLWQRHYAPKILFSGGPVSRKYLDDSHYMKELAVNLGVPEEAILRENRSRNTLENLRFSKKVMDENGLKTALLVTSPLHMRRSLLFAEKAGLTAYPAPSPFWVHAKKGEDIYAQVKIEMIGMVVYSYFDEETVRRLANYVKGSFLYYLF